MLNATTVVDTETLASHLDDENWIVFDCRFDLMAIEAGEHSYQTSHIPNARYVHLDRDLSSPIAPTTGRHPLPDEKLLAEKLGRWGADNAKQIVAYDDASGAIAARMWWLLRWLGHQNVAVLDGGWTKWCAEGRPVSSSLPQPKQVRFAPAVRNDMNVATHFIEDQLDEPQLQLIDVRARARYIGKAEPIDAVAGHIPGAINIPFDDNLNSQGCFLTPNELREHYTTRMGNTNAKSWIIMCGSGVTACHTLLALAHAGLEGPRCYCGSWSEWIRDSNHPIVTEE